MSQPISIDTIDSFKESWNDLDIRNAPIRKSWQPFFNEIFKQPHVIEHIEQFIKDNNPGSLIFPHKSKIFNAFNSVPIKDLKVIIIGQDPYHSLSNQAQGFSFLVPKTMKYPPSLNNIISEVKKDVGLDCDNLETWTSQGVLLLNSSLTVKPKQAGSHIKYWEPITDEIITLITSLKKNIVFLLWGKYAQSKSTLINKHNGHHILTAGHPSPLANMQNWFNKHLFSQTNELLIKNKQSPIIWGTIKEENEKKDE